jgi:transposase-like protein
MKGRPTKLTPEVQRLIEQSLRNGATYEIAAHVAGIDVRTMYRWLAAGKRAKSGAMYEFCHAVKRQEAAAAQEALMVIRSAATGKEGYKGNWQAGAWLLERRFGYQRKSEIHIGGVSYLEELAAERGLDLEAILLALAEDLEADGDDD